MTTNKKTYFVGLQIQTDPQDDSPSDWDWPVLLDTPDREDVTLVRCVPVDEAHPTFIPWTKEWNEEAFTNPVTREPYGVPNDLRTAAERIACAYGLRGICDPMYIANVIAKEVGRGDGESHFYGDEA